MGLLGGPHPRCGDLHAILTSHLRASRHHASLRGASLRGASLRGGPSPHGDLASHRGVHAILRVDHTSLHGLRLHRDDQRVHDNHRGGGVMSMAPCCGHILERVPDHGMD